MAKKAARPRKPREPQPEQAWIDGMEPPRIPALDSAAKIYYSAMKERVALSKEEDEAKQNLIMKMKEHDVEFYETPLGLVVSLTNSSNVRVKPKSKDDTEEGGD